MNNFPILIFVVLAVILGAYFYTFFRLWHLIPVFPASRILLICIAVFVSIIPFVALGFGDKFPVPITSVLFRIGTSWMILMLYLILIFLLLDLMRVCGVQVIKQFMFNSWTGFIILTLFFSILMTYGHINYLNKKRVELTIKTEKIGEADAPLKIVAISDLHLGYGIGTREFRKWVELINKENPDVLLIAGDVIDNSLKPLYERNFAEIFRKIKTKHGIFLAPGNHEYISNINKSIDFFTQVGVVVLRDSAVLVNDAYYIVGRDDRSNPNRKALAELTASLDQSKPIILIDHQPFHFDEVAKNNIDLKISGHTHHGQIWPINWITNAMFDLSRGYLKKDNSHFYVTTGIGIWGGKFRIGTRSEYVVIHIEKK